MEDCSWSKQDSWDIEFLPICLNIAADNAPSELYCGNVGESLCFLQATRARVRMTSVGFFVSPVVA